ncbi:MAG TPA: radical SAM protein [Candidatus Latescibacteria bacterium]|nr:radical SAM protein [Candidatus Latescibacterota bacterium]
MKPLLLHYYVTYRCNARCSFCTIWDPAKWDHRATPSWDQMTSNLTAARKLGTRFVDFTGGEPLLYHDLPRALRLAKVLGFRTSVTTNCLRYPARAKDLAGQVDLLHFSLDAAEKDTHDRIRGVPCFDRVMESLDVARALGEHPDILFTATEETFEQIAPLAAIAQAYNTMLIVNPEFPWAGNKGVGERELAYLERFARERNVYVNRAFHRLIRAGGNQRAHPVCHAVEAVIVISPDDHLLLPCFHRQRERIPINGQLEKVRAGSLVKAYKREDGRHVYCQGCTINCYMDPSFQYACNTYLFLSLAAKAKYVWSKYLLLG